MRKISIASELLRKLASSSSAEKMTPLDNPGGSSPIKAASVENRPEATGSNTWQKPSPDHD